MKADTVEFLHLLLQIYYSYLNEESEYKRMSAAASSSVKSDSNIRFNFDFSIFQFVQMSITFFTGTVSSFFRSMVRSFF